MAIFNREAWNSFRPLTWAQGILGANLFMPHSKCFQQFTEFYRVIFAVGLLVVAAFQLAADISNGIKITEPVFVLEYIRALYPIVILVMRDKGFKNNFVNFLNHIGKSDKKLKINKEKCYNIIKRFHTLCVSVILAAAIFYMCFASYQLKMFRPLAVAWLLVDLEILSYYFCIYNIEMRLKVLTCEMRRRRRDPIETKPSLIGRVLISERYLNSLRTGSVLTIPDLIEAYEELFTCSKIFNEMFFSAIVLSMTYQFSHIIGAIFYVVSFKGLALFVLARTMRTLFFIWLPCVAGSGINSALQNIRLEHAREVTLDLQDKNERRLSKDLLLTLELRPLHFTVGHMRPLDLSLAIDITDMLVTISIMVIQVFKLIP